MTKASRTFTLVSLCFVFIFSFFSPLVRFISLHSSYRFRASGCLFMIQDGQSPDDLRSSLAHSIISDQKLKGPCLKPAGLPNTRSLMNVNEKSLELSVCKIRDLQKKFPVKMKGFCFRVEKATSRKNLR